MGLLFSFFIIMNESNIEKRLFDLQDKEYKEFQSKLIPNINKDNIIGIRIPHLRKLAKEIAKENQRGDFLNSLPHKYYEENHLHSFLIEEMKDEKECLESLDKFLPYVDNWAVCDSCSPKALKKNLDLLLEYIKSWISSEKEYVSRFGILSLMRYFLEKESFKEEYLEMVCGVKSEYYYVKMMQAWFFATALSKQYDATIEILKENKLKIKNLAFSSILWYLIGEPKKYKIIKYTRR